MVLDASSAGQERSVLILHPHWKVLLGPVIFGALVVAAALVGLTVIPAGSAAGTGPSRPGTAPSRPRPMAGPGPGAGHRGCVLAIDRLGDES